MTSPRNDLEYVLATEHGVISRSAHPELATAIAWRLRNGGLASILPGVYSSPAGADLFDVRVRATTTWERDAIFTGRVAARLTFWPELPVSEITLTAPAKRKAPPGFRVDRRKIPPELVVEAGGIRCTAPALTALDLCDVVGGDGIDTVLRTRAATLADLYQAFKLTPGRSGNGKRRRLLLESRHEPWSRAEREAHALLVDQGITGWVANYPVQRLSVRYYIDIAFPEAMLAIEIDGREFHGAAAFERDRWRQNDLVASGWRVLRLTWDMITNYPHRVLALIAELLEA